MPYIFASPDFDHKVPCLLHKFNNGPWSTATKDHCKRQSGNSPNLRRKILKASRRICKKPEPIAVLIHAISNGCGKVAVSVLSPPCNLLVPQQFKRREEWTQRIKKGVWSVRAEKTYAANEFRVKISYSARTAKKPQKPICREGRLSTTRSASWRAPWIRPFLGDAFE